MTRVSPSARASRSQLTGDPRRRKRHETIIDEQVPELLGEEVCLLHPRLGYDSGPGEATSTSRYARSTFNGLCAPQGFVSVNASVIAPVAGTGSSRRPMTSSRSMLLTTLTGSANSISPPVSHSRHDDGEGSRDTRGIRDHETSGEADARSGEVGSDHRDGQAPILAAMRSASKHAWGAGSANRISRSVLAGRIPDDDAWKRALVSLRLRRVRTPRRAATLLVRSMDRLVGRVRQPTGLIVVVVGPDGAGKSALATSLLDRCGAFFWKTRRLHWRPGAPPAPRRLRRAPEH